MRNSPVTKEAANALPAAEAPVGAETEDAAEYARRAAVLAPRQDFGQAESSFTRACELAPDHAEYFYQRGMTRWLMRQGDKAMADFDQAITLKADYVAAWVSRAELWLQRGDKLHSSADLDTADTVASKQSDVRLAMARTYERADLLPEAITQLDLWVFSHPDDARLPEALNLRCKAAALRNIDLESGLKACDSALKRVDKKSALYGKVLDSRGLLRLRSGEYGKSIADYDGSPAIQPKDAWSLYGRGIDKLRTQMRVQGDADISQAMALRPSIADEFSRRGIVP